MFAASKTASVSGGYQISRSLRFNSADSAYLNRTPASAGNRTTWTWSGWIKFSKITGVQFIFGASSDNYANNFTLLQMDNAASTLTFYDYTSAYNFQLTPSMVFRDPSAWYHIVLTYDSNNATSSDRVKMYVNGSQITAFSTASYPTSGKTTVLNSTTVHNYGTSSYPISGYVTETNFIDGQALTPSSFGETNAQTGVWQPKAYSGSYGTNGFYLNFSDNSNTTAATLGKDYSGNGNNWTPNNFSVTAGAGNDSLIDSPTAYGFDTGVGGTVRGNYCTVNPLLKGGNLTIANGNLDVNSNGSSWTTAYGTFLIPTSGKWYWEVTAGGSNTNPGIALSTSNLAGNLATYPADTIVSYTYYGSNGNKLTGPGNTSAAYGSSFTTNDVIGIAFDADAGTLTFYKNNTSQGTAFSSLTAQYVPVFGVYDSGVQSTNFGQRPFVYTAPSGFKALCTQNLPTPTIGATSTTLAGKFFNPVLWTGTSANPRTITGVGFQPDLVWVKKRSAAGNNFLQDAVRGVTSTDSRSLVSNNTDVETNYYTTNGGVTAFASDGFTTSGGSTNLNLNESGVTYVAWNWKANGAGSTNTAGTVTSTVSANTTSGFSVVTWTGNGADVSIGHGLGVAPSMVIHKFRSAVSNWSVYTSTTGAGKRLKLNSTDAVATDGSFPTTPTSTVFYINGGSNDNGVTMLAYCFAEVAGYSKFGSYTGNGSADGPFVYCGFRPAFVLIKFATGLTNWLILDDKRDTYNVERNKLYPNVSDAEDTSAENAIDFVSNGFKIRTGNNKTNDPGATMIYAAFASAPLKFSLAR